MDVFYIQKLILAIEIVSAMITRLGVAPRKPDMDTRSFQAHWAGPHGDVVTSLPKLRRYWQNHAVLDDRGEATLPWPGFDACSDLEFDDLASMDAAFASPAYAGAVKADEGDFVEKRLGGLILGHRHGPTEPPEGAGVRLMTFLRCAPGVARAEFEAAVLDMPTPSPTIVREHLLALPPGDTGGRASIFDAVDMLWMEDAATAQSYVTSTEARQRAHPSSALFRGASYLLAKVRVIV